MAEDAAHKVREQPVYESPKFGFGCLSELYFGSRSFRRQGWVTAQDASRLSFGLMKSNIYIWEAAAQPHIAPRASSDRGSMLNNLTLLR